MDEGNELGVALRATMDRQGRARPRSELREKATAYVRAQLEAGATMSDLASLLGVKASTLSAWCRETGSSRRRGRPKGSSEPGLSRVRVRPVGSPDRTLVLEGPGGWRITGLTITDVAKLLSGRP